MKNTWAEFKAFALGGNMLDLALGFLIGAAFAGLVESLAKNILLQLVAAIFTIPDFTGLSVGVNGTQLWWGRFATDLLNFLLLGLVLFGVVKLVKRAGLGNFRAQGQMECPYCKEFVAIDAIKCKWCTADIEPEVLEDEDRELIEKRKISGAAGV